MSDAARRFWLGSLEVIAIIGVVVGLLAAIFGAVSMAIEVMALGATAVVASLVILVVCGIGQTLLDIKGMNAD